MNRPSGGRADAAPSYGGQAVLFATTRVLLNTMYRMVYPFLPVFGRALGVGLPALSLAVTLRSVTGCFSPLLATLADSLGRRAGMLSGLVIFTAGTAMVLIRPGFPAFVLCLVVTIVGKYVFDPAIQAHLGDRVPYARRGLVIALSELGWSVSFIAGVPAAGYLIERGGWRAPFVPLTLLGALAVALYARLIPRDAHHRRHYLGLAASLQAVVTFTPALLGLSVGLLATSANEVINLVFGVWMEGAFDVKIAGLGAASAIVGVSELAGEILVGALTDRLGKRRAIGIGLVLNSLAAAALPWLGTDVAGALTGLALFYVTFEFTMVSMIPLMTEILPGARATLLAAYVAALSLGRAVGALIAPPLYAFGIGACAVAALVFNQLAWFTLRRLDPGRT